MINTISVEPFTKKCIYWISLYARVHIPVLCHIWTLGKSSMNSFTSGNPGELSTSSTLLRKAWMEEKRRRLTVHHMQRTKSILSLSEWVFQLWHVCCNVLQDLCEVVGGAVRNGLIGQSREEIQNWLGVQAPRTLGSFTVTAEDRRSHCCGSLGRQHIKPQMKFTIRRDIPEEHRVRTQTGCLVTDGWNGWKQ